MEGPKRLPSRAERHGDRDETRSWSVLRSDDRRAIEERVGLGERQKQRTDVGLRGVELILEHPKITRIVGALAPSVGEAKPRGDHAVAHLLAFEQAADQLGHAGEGTIDIGVDKTPRGVDRPSIFERSEEHTSELQSRENL